jgi:hypothetical protein
MEKTLIKVTARNIRNAVRGSCVNCPIALAVGKYFPGLVCLVGGDSVRIYDKAGNRRDTCKIPRVAQRFIRKFDKALPVQPFSFYLGTNLQSNSSN